VAGLLMSAHGSVRAMAQALPGLQVDTKRMRANLDTLRAELPADAADEWFTPNWPKQAAGLAHAQADALRLLLASAPNAHTVQRKTMNDYDKGMINRRRVLGDAWVDKSIAKSNSFNGEFQDLITRYAWNEVWGRPALGDKTRRLMVLSTMIALKAYEEFAMHVRAALDGPPESRLTPDDIKEVIMQAAIYCGVPAANHAFAWPATSCVKKACCPLEEKKQA
jgi:4-carboxymuconolactone decarboxylase